MRRADIALAFRLKVDGLELPFSIDPADFQFPEGGWLRHKLALCKQSAL
jgi:hypothetical protein